MPKLETQTRKVQDVRKGDEVMWNGVGHVVTTTQTKTKFVYLDTADSVTLRIEHGTDVDVKREVPTTEEKIAQAKERLLEAAESEVASTYRRLAEVRVKLTDAFAKDYAATYSDIQSLIDAQARVQVIAHLLPEGEHTEAEKIAHIKVITDAARRRLIENGRIGRSTSMVSNEMEAAERESLSNLVGGFSSISMYVEHLDQLEAELATER